MTTQQKHRLNLRDINITSTYFRKKQKNRKKKEKRGEVSLETMFGYTDMSEVPATVNLKFDILADKKTRNGWANIADLAGAIVKALGSSQTNSGLCLRTESIHSRGHYVPYGFTGSLERPAFYCDLYKSHHADKKKPLERGFRHLRDAKDDEGGLRFLFDGAHGGPRYFLMESVEDNEWQQRIQITTPVLRIERDHAAQLKAFLDALKTVDWPLKIDASSSLKVLADFCRCSYRGWPRFCLDTCRNPFNSTSNWGVRKWKPTDQPKVLSVAVLVKLTLLDRLFHPKHDLVPEDDMQERTKYGNTEPRHTEETTSLLKKHIPAMERFTVPQRIISAKPQEDADDLRRRLLDTFHSIWEQSILEHLGETWEPRWETHFKPYRRKLAFTEPLHPCLRLNGAAMEFTCQPSLDLELLWIGC
jgi:hypothetical protein